MKKNKLLILVVALIATVSFTSCLNDDYETRRNRPTAAELKEATNPIQGLYQGKLYRLINNERTGRTEKTDSANTSWEFKDDSVLVIKDVPSKLLAANVTNSALKQAIEALPNQQVKCSVSIFYVKPIQYFIIPFRVDLGQLTYDGKTHDVSISFYFSEYYSYGNYVSERKITILRLIEAGVVVDGVLDKSSYKEPDSFYLISDPRA